ncbi:unnamed protein product [Amoebophrya sp. A120]|nr:unnamed protein product [Amoebophrya sp. A120]|eukprot:GSA120T00004506001.1
MASSLGKHKIWSQPLEKWLKEDRREALEALCEFHWDSPIFQSDNFYNSEDKIFATLKKKHGPFKKGQKTAIPIWLGLELEQRKHGMLWPPHWLTERKLKQVLLNEKRNPHKFEPVDEWFIWIAHTFLMHSIYFRVNPRKEITDRFHELVNFRRHKAKEGLRMIGDNILLDCTFLTKPEITFIRDRSIKAMSWMEYLKHPYLDAVDTSENASSSGTSSKPGSTTNPTSTGGNRSANDHSKSNSGSSGAGSGNPNNVSGNQGGAFAGIGGTRRFGNSRNNAGSSLAELMTNSLGFNNG